ncbi:MaoC family dehydratase N-terminal domain-containing protein [Chloroflexota bacterium]
MSEDTVISDELRNLLDVEFGPEVHEVEKGMVKKFAEAIDDSNPLWQKIVPPTFFAVLKLEELYQKVRTAECPLSRLLNGGSDLEYYQPIAVGDVVSVTGKVTGMRERVGKSGKMIFMILEMTYKNQSGEEVARLRQNLIRY